MFYFSFFFRFFLFFFFSSRIPRSEALVEGSGIFFAKQPFHGNYSTLDSNTSTVISNAFAYSSTWRRKPRQGLLSLLNYD